MKNSEHNIYYWLVIILSSLLTILLVFMVWTAQVEVPRFEQLLSDFGGEMPAFTTFILSNYALGWLAPGLGLSACIYLFATHKKKSAYRKTAVLTAVLTIVAVSLWQVAVLIGVYLPVFNIGRVVS